ncbi:MAG: CoA transferase [Micrococcales bacterium]|nr:CoA transferase [Micrococcales bacterium]
MTAALEGVLVADFSRVLAGPLATMNLADLGADVVKVERPGLGDDTRAWGPPWADGSGTDGQGRVATYYESVNRSKRSLALDLTDAQDLVAAKELAQRADVFVENFRPGTLSRYGLDYESVAAGNPGVVYASVTGFGRGPGAALPGYDFVVQAVGGLMSITGEAGGPPTKAGVALVDVLTGKDTTIGILAALAARSRTGRGCRVEVNLLSSLLAALVNQASGYLGAGVVPHRMGNEHPSIAPYETLRCADALLAVACGNDGQFVRLAEELGRPDLARDERFARNAARVAHRRHLIDALEVALAADTAASWQRRLNAVGVAAGGVNDLAAAFALAEDLGLAPTYDLGGAASRQVRHPITYSEDLIRQPSPPPGLGADDHQLRAWLAGPATDGIPRHAPMMEGTR